MATSTTPHQPPPETIAAAEREHAHIIQLVVDPASGKVKARTLLIDGGGSLEVCRLKIKRLQNRHRTSGYNTEAGYWFAHDLPEGGIAPKVVYRWILE